VGFTDTGVLSLVLGEALALTLAGGAIGLGLSWLLVSMGDPTNGSFPVFYIPMRHLFLGVVLIALMAFVAGIVPALQARRLQIADALRR
jgi:putative ABC transport system permease protein